MPLTSIPRSWNGSENIRASSSIAHQHAPPAHGVEGLFANLAGKPAQTWRVLSRTQKRHPTPAEDLALKDMAPRTKVVTLPLGSPLSRCGTRELAESEAQCCSVW